MKLFHCQQFHYNYLCSKMHETHRVGKTIEAEWHIYMSAIYNTIGWDDNSLPLRRQTIIWTNASLLSNWHLTANLKYISIKMRTFQKLGFKMLQNDRHFFSVSIRWWIIFSYKICAMTIKAIATLHHKRLFVFTNSMAYANFDCALSPETDQNTVKSLKSFL